MKIAQDKKMHFLTGLAGGIVYGALFPVWWALGTAMLPGPIKEGLDALQNHLARKAGKPAPHSVEFWDAAATTLGGWVGVALVLGVKWAAR